MDSLFDTTQSAQTVSSPTTMNSQYGMTPPPADMSATIKMEDLQVPFDPSAASESTPSVNGEGKPVKKRKSWGQVLPEPKTNLPPRKRAKTEDEKEQRRIERVKRNRLAAHNSRERKRQEYEHIQVEKDKLEADLVAARQALARMGAELKAYREKYPGGVEFSFEPTSPIAELDSFLASTSTINPAQTTTTSSSFPSPVSMTMDSMDSPRDSSCAPETPNFSEATPDFDTTRYPAEILCDLQCQSTSAAPASLPAVWAFLSLFNLSLQLPWTTSLSTIFSTSTSSRTPPPTVWNPLLAWWTATFSSLPASSATTIPALAFLTTLMQSTSTCRQPLAQLTLATGLSQRGTSIEEVARSPKASRRASNEGSTTQRRLRSLRSRQMGRRRIGSWVMRRTRALGRSLDASRPQSRHCV